MMAAVPTSRSTPARSPSAIRHTTEAAYAQKVADRYRTRHYVEPVDTDDFGLLDTLAEVYDEPFADSSAIPTFRLCELARKSVTVALSGDGGDENFAGYRRYRWHVYEERMRSVMPLALRAPVFGLLGNLYPKADWAPKVLRAKSTLEALARDSVEGYFHSVSVMSDATRDRLSSDSFRRELQGYRAIEVLQRHARNAPRDEPLSLVQYLDMKTYLVGDIMTKGRPRQHGAHSLESGNRCSTIHSSSGSRDCRRASSCAGAKANTCSRRRSNPTCHTRSCTDRRWVFRCRSRAGSVGRCGSG
jgi:asparagine synthase (glutamine-hydrolysing)